MSARPLVSIILCVKNGMPYLPQALESIARQTYEHIELVVQDGCSTDGSLELLERFRGARAISIESANDGGIGPAYNRAAERCRGEIIASIDADNLLEPDGIAQGVAACQARPEAAAIYGAAHLVDEHGKRVSTFVPSRFDLLRLLACELVPPFATTFFRPARCGGEMRFDTSLKTCADYDLWLRLSDHPIDRIPQIIGSTRLSNNSMTCRPQSYEQFCRDKMASLARYFARFPASPPLTALKNHAEAGIYLWAAESLLGLEGPGLRCGQMVAEARRRAPDAQRLRRLEQAIASYPYASDARHEPAHPESYSPRATSRPARPRARSSGRVNASPPVETNQR